MKMVVHQELTRAQTSQKIVGVRSWAYVLTTAVLWTGCLLPHGLAAPSDLVQHRDQGPPVSLSDPKPKTTVRTIEDVSEVIRTHPRDPALYFERGRAHALAGDEASARADMRQASQLRLDALNEVVQKNPEDQSALLHRGIVRAELGDLSGAMADYDHSIRLNPSHPPTYLYRGQARYQTGDTPGAIQDYSDALRLNPQMSEAYTNRALLRRATGDNAGADQDLEQARKLSRGVFAEPQP